MSELSKMVVSALSLVMPGGIDGIGKKARTQGRWRGPRTSLMKREVVLELLAKLAV